MRFFQCEFLMKKKIIWTLIQRNKYIRRGVLRCNETCVISIIKTPTPTHNGQPIKANEFNTVRIKGNEGLEVIKFIRLKRCHQKKLFIHFLYNGSFNLFNVVDWSRWRILCFDFCLHMHSLHSFSQAFGSMLRMRFSLFYAKRCR